MATKASSKTRKSSQPVKKAVRTSLKPSSTKVDYYPNKMTVAVSALAGTMLVLMALIAVLGWQ